MPSENYAFEMWFVEESGWGPTKPYEEYRLPEYALARAAWNRALAAAERKMPTLAFGSITRMEIGSEGIVAWNCCRAEMEDALASLKAPSGGPTL